MPHLDWIRCSVVMPAYNAAPFIAHAIESVMTQSEQRIELVVTDDASTDSTVTIVSHMAASDNRIRLLRNARNSGPGGARNRALAAARGDWIALLDADDAFEPHRIATLIAAGEHCGADIVADNLLLCPNGAGEPAGVMLPPQVLSAPHWMSAAEFVAGNVGSRWTPRVSYGFLQPLMRRSFLDTHKLRYNGSNRFGEDFLLYLDCLLHGARWWLVPQAMYRYRVRSGTLTDVQSAGDLLRIRTIEDALLRGNALVAADAALARALRRHKAVISHFYYYRAFTDAIKARTLRRALRVLLESATGFRDIASESLMQAPRIAAKALRGGYRRGVAARAGSAEQPLAQPAADPRG